VYLSNHRRWWLTPPFAHHQSVADVPKFLNYLHLDDVTRQQQAEKARIKAELAHQADLDAIAAVRYAFLAEIYTRGCYWISRLLLA
jgi:hypothetical protein